MRTKKAAGVRAPKRTGGSSPSPRSSDFPTDEEMAAIKAADNAGLEVSDNADPQPPRVSPSEEPIKYRRISIPVTEDGNIAWDTMRLSTKNEVIASLKKALEDRSLMASAGVSVPAPVVVEIFDASWTGTIFDAIAAVECYLAQRQGIPADIAKSVLVYNDAEKAMLGAPLARIINKYASQYDWMVRFKDEIAFGILFFSITSVKFKVAQFSAEQRKVAAIAAKAKPASPASVPDAAESVPVQ